VWDDSVLIFSVLTGSLKYHRNNVVIIIPADCGLLRAQGSFYIYAALFFRDIPVGLCILVFVGGRSGTPSVIRCNCIAVGQSTAISNNRKNILELPYMLL
jgi:hypothetical protein